MSPAALRTLATTGVTNATIVTTAETVVATLTGITTDNPSTIVYLEAYANIAVAAATTSLVLRVRRTGLTGTLVGAAQTTTVTASTTATELYQVVDTPGEVAGLTYVLTAVCTAAGANSTVNAVGLQAQLQ